MANFDLDDETKQKQSQAQALQDSIKADQQNRESFGPGQGLPTPDEIARHDAAEQQKWQAESDNQARRGGVETADAVAPAGGIAGLFGAKDKSVHYTAGHSQDTTTDANKAELQTQIRGVQNRATQTMQGANLIRADAPYARGQVGLAQALTASANGQGPSAAQDQLMAGTDAARAAAMSLAQSGHNGGSGTALKAAMMQQGIQTQQAANASAQLRAQEMQTARGQLGDVLGTARGQELQANTTQAGLQQQTQATNLQASIEQQKQKDAMVDSFLKQGFSLDEARRRTEIQQAQFNAQLLAQQAAADKGVAIQSQQTGGQMLGAGLSTGGALLASFAA